MVKIFLYLLRKLLMSKLTTGISKDVKMQSECLPQQEVAPSLHLRTISFVSSETEHKKSRTTLSELLSQEVYDMYIGSAASITGKSGFADFNFTNSRLAWIDYVYKTSQ